MTALDLLFDFAARMTPRAMLLCLLIVLGWIALNLPTENSGVSSDRVERLVDEKVKEEVGRQVGPFGPP